MQISTTPAGATCTVDRDGYRLGQVVSTPGSIRMDKSKDDIAVTCSKQGFQTATVSRSPKFVGTTFGNIVLGGVFGALVDAASGANFEYPAEIALQLASAGPISVVPAVPSAIGGVAVVGQAAELSPFDGRYIGISRISGARPRDLWDRNGIQGGSGCPFLTGVPVPLMIQTGTVYSSAWSGTVSPTGIITMQNRRGARIDGTIVTGEIRAQYQSRACAVAFTWRRL